MTRLLNTRLFNIALLTSLVFRLSACDTMPADDWLNSSPHVVEHSAQSTPACGPGRRSQGLC